MISRLCFEVLMSLGMGRLGVENGWESILWTIKGVSGWSKHVSGLGEPVQVLG